jgi:hypothetical protein
MAVKRVNLMDAITGTASVVARSRTAVVRRGQVTTPTDVAGVVKVNLGGGTVDAIALKTGSLAANDQVAVLGDTDAYWVVGVIGANVAETYVDADFGTVSTGYTRTGATGTKVGLPGGKALVEVTLTLTNTAAVTIPASGVLSITAATVPASLRPAVERRWVYVEVQAAASGVTYWNLINSGFLRLIGGTPNLTLAAGSSRTVALLYLM